MARYTVELENPEDMLILIPIVNLLEFDVVDPDWIEASWMAEKALPSLLQALGYLQDIMVATDRPVAYTGLEDYPEALRELARGMESIIKQGQAQGLQMRQELEAEEASNG